FLEPKAEAEHWRGVLGTCCFILAEEGPFIRASALERRLRCFAVEADQRLAVERRLRAVRLARNGAQIFLGCEAEGDRGIFVDPELAAGRFFARHDLRRLAGDGPHVVACRAEMDVADADSGTDGEQVGHGYNRSV